MKFRIVIERNRFYIEYRGWFLWRRLNSLDGWWSADTIDGAVSEIDKLMLPDSSRQIINYPLR